MPVTRRVPELADLECCWGLLDLIEVPLKVTMRDKVWLLRHCAWLVQAWSISTGVTPLEEKQAVVTSSIYYFYYHDRSREDRLMQSAKFKCRCSQTASKYKLTNESKYHVQ